MQRKDRIDAVGALQHIIIRAIPCKAIFRDATESFIIYDESSSLFKVPAKATELRKRIKRPGNIILPNI